jgi:alcohol dehydrogenase class IV
MWFFQPRHHLWRRVTRYSEQLEGQRAFIVTDAVTGSDTRRASGSATSRRVRGECVRPRPSRPFHRDGARGAAAMLEFRPDWVVGLGGGSSLDA